MFAVRRFFVVVGLVLALSVGGWTECMAESPAGDEHACCLAMGEDCGDGMDMACCAVDRPTRDLGPTILGKPTVDAPVAVVGPHSVEAVPPLDDRAHLVAARAFEREPWRLPERPTYLRLSVFLI